MVKSRMPTGKTVSGRKKSKVKKAEAKSKTRARRKMSKREAGKKADHNPAAAKRRCPIAGDLLQRRANETLCILLDVFRGYVVGYQLELKRMFKNLLVISQVSS